MAFSAVHPEVGRIDATLPDLGVGLAWGAVHKVRPRVALRCPECKHGVHAKVSARRLRYFAHDPGRTVDCAWLNESLEHHLLKLELATAIRAADWHAELEVRAEDGAWRADVLARSHDATRWVAWEAQLSPITDDDITDRTSRYRDDGIGVCWVGIGSRVPWLGTVPSVRVQEPRDEKPWLVVDGVARFRYEQGSWSVVEDMALTRFVRWSLQEKMLAHPVLPRYRWIRLPGACSFATRRMVWTSPRSIGEEARHEVLRARQDELKRRRKQLRREQGEARRREELRRQEVAAAAELARREEQEAIARARREEWEVAEQVRLEEQRRLLAARAEQEQREREAAERERLRRERDEQQAAEHWWAQLSVQQLEQLHAALAAAVSNPMWKQHRVRVELDREGSVAHFAYGVAVLAAGRFYAILRPSPASMYRLPRLSRSELRIFVRNAREARLITDTGTVPSEWVTHFDLPDEEQMSLI